MMICRSDKWELPLLKDGLFICIRKGYPEPTFVRKCKYVDVENDIVYYLDTTAKEIVTIAYSCKNKVTKLQLSEIKKAVLSIK